MKKLFARDKSGNKLTKVREGSDRAVYEVRPRICPMISPLLNRAYIADGSSGDGEHADLRG